MGYFESGYNLVTNFKRGNGTSIGHSEIGLLCCAREVAQERPGSRLLSWGNTSDNTYARIYMCHELTANVLCVEGHVDTLKYPGYVASKTEFLHMSSDTTTNPGTCILPGKLTIN